MRASVHVDLPGWTKEGLPALKVSHRFSVFFLMHWYQECFGSGSEIDDSGSEKLFIGKGKGTFYSMELIVMAT